MYCASVMLSFSAAQSISRDANGNGHGHVILRRASAAGFGFADGPRHVHTSLAAVRHAALGVYDADVGRCCELHAAYLGDGVFAAALFAVDVFAVLRVADVELYLVHDDALQVAHYLHGRDWDEDVKLIGRILVELYDGARDAVVCH